MILRDALQARFGDRPLADNSRHTVEESRWDKCRTCRRKAVDLAVLNHKSEILCCAHLHHDHIKEYFRSLFDGYAYCPCWGSWIINASATISRFREVELCSFCNEAEGNAKKLAGTAKWFSFTPDELSDIVRVNGPGRVDVDRDRARAIWNDNTSLLARRMQIGQRLFEVALAGELGPAGHPMRPRKPGETSVLRELSCDGGYRKRRAAEAAGL